MLTLHLVSAILGLACFLVAALEVSVRRINFIAAGLFLWLLSTLIAR